MIGRVAFRFNSPEAALRMQYHELKYFHNWIKVVEEHEREQLRK
jgi:hypothetical protein